MFKLAFRNSIRNLSKNLPLIIILSLTFMLFIIFNSILDNVNNSFSKVFINNISGTYTLSEKSDDNFTLFGSDLLLVSDYITPPVISNYQEVENEIALHVEQIAYTSVVTSGAQIEIGKQKSGTFIFGVDFEDYFEFFPDLRVTHFSGIDIQDEGIYLNSEIFKKFSNKEGRELNEFDYVVLSAAVGSDFVIRELPLKGYFEYPLDDKQLNTLVLTDASTARSLNGYGIDDIVAEDTLEDQNFDPLSLLGGVDSANSDQAESNSVFDDLDSFFTIEEETPEAEPDVWNFMLFKESSELDVLGALAELVESKNHLVLKDWKEAVGGNALIISFIQLIVNAGLLFLLGGVCSVTVNSIVLSILERRKEIGTMRAIGALKQKVARMVMYEIGFIIIGTLVAGSLLGCVSVKVLNAFELNIDNLYINTLFGGKNISGILSWNVILFQATLGFVVYAFSIIIPLRKLLKITPQKALM